MSSVWINLSYLVASVLFIMGLKGLTHPRTAVRGNWMGAVAMLLAIVVTLTDQHILSFHYIIIGLIVGSIIGALLANFIKMTAMPQLVAVFNGFGGIASALVAGAALIEAKMGIIPSNTQMMVATAASGLVGAVTFTGSLIAFVKLQELFFKKPVFFLGQQFFNALMAAGCVALAVMLVIDPQPQYYWGLVGLASILGITLVIPIGGADMPVVISLLNSYSGIAAAATGFVLSNNVLIVSGSLVGASGLILTQIMCKAMNRTLSNVIFGKLDPSSAATGGQDDIYSGRIKSTSADEVAMLFDTASNVIIVPGYGMAVAQAQHPVKELVDALETKGIEVNFAIHPVAGRMPGHMNVLLAEAEVPYEQLKEMDVINPSFEQADVAIVLGANDVVNPDARDATTGPIAGMPILNVDKAKTVVVIKRSLSPGFAGVPNPLFAADNTLMLFGDGKAAVVDMVKAIREG